MPLVAIAGNCLKQIPEIDRMVVSTDHGQIKLAAESSGLAAPFIRPRELSGDLVSDWEVLNHALLETEKIDGKKYDIIMMIQPTSPLRTPTQLLKTLNYFNDGNWDAVWTISKTDLTFHPLKQFIIRENKCLDYFSMGGKTIVARQQLDPTYHCNGVAYVFSRECILEQKNKMGFRTGAYIIEDLAISIDTEEDIQEVEKYLMDSK